MNQNQIDIKCQIQDFRNGVAEEFIHTHARINANNSTIHEALSSFYALIELLEEKRMISKGEIDERKKLVTGRLGEKFVDSGMGLLYSNPEDDKYEYKQEGFEDCQNRVQICEAKCCKIPFTLSRQDVEEGIVRFEFSRPYLIAHSEDGYCVHLDRNSYQCSVRNNRPVPCRHFVCRGNEKWKMWVDYEKKLLNNEMLEQLEIINEKIYACLEKKK